MITIQSYMRTSALENLQAKVTSRWRREAQEANRCGLVPWAQQLMFMADHAEAQFMQRYELQREPTREEAAKLRADVEQAHRPKPEGLIYR